tara:strand:- start:315 stop:761 length:447 start_codon:yes stop_codon:yes gene_type:complete
MTSENALFKIQIQNMSEALNTKKDIDEFCKEAWKEIKEKTKEAKAADKAAKAKPRKGFDKDGNPKKKRAPSAYNIFVKDKYAEIKEANADLDRVQIFSEIARVWQEMKPKDADPKKANDDDEFAEIQEVQEDNVPIKKRGRKTKKDSE